MHGGVEMKLTKRMIQIAQDLADRLHAIGFAKKTPDFAEFNLQQYCTIGRVWLDQKEGISVDLYFGPYFGGSHPLWVGFRSKARLPVETVSGAFQQPFTTLVNDDWDWDAKSPTGRHALHDEPRRRMEGAGFTGIEDYDDGELWFGRYFAMESGVEADAFAFIRQLLEPFVPKFKTGFPSPPRAGTTKQVLQFVRVGHQAFRDAVEEHWGGRCAVTDTNFRFALRASHILPWQRFPDARTDPDNGLLLVGTLDALFDRGHVTFDDDGKIRISRFVPRDQFEKLQLDPKSFLRSQPFTEGHRSFLKEHRRLIFRGE